MEILKNTEERMRLTESLREYFKDELEEGREEGRAEGRVEEKSAIVQKMKNEGIPIDLISRCTGLSSGEIQAI